MRSIQFNIVFSRRRAVFPVARGTAGASRREQVSRPSRKQRLREEKARKLRLTGREKLLLCLIIALLLAASLAFEHMIATRRQAASLASQLAQWRAQFNLNDEQEQHIRRLEREFHGTGSLFARRRNPSAAEISEHQSAIARSMNPEDAARFLAPRRGKSAAEH